MGNRASSELKRKELREFKSMTHFTEDEIKQLHGHFKSLAGTVVDDGLIDVAEFQKALGLNNSYFCTQMFHLFDENGDGNINFTEFLCGLSILCTRGTIQEKADFSYRIYNSDANGPGITPSMLRKMLAATMEESNLALTDTMLDALVDSTFKQIKVETPGIITKRDYVAMVFQNNDLLSNMTLDFQKLIAELKWDNGEPPRQH